MADREVIIVHTIKHKVRVSREDQIERSAVLLRRALGLHCGRGNVEFGPTTYSELREVQHAELGPTEERVMELLDEDSRRATERTGACEVWSEQWMKDAACVDNPRFSMDDFFPEDLFSNLNSPEAVAHLAALRSLCAGCLSHEECRAWADERHYEVGFIAGETHLERRARQRAAAPCRAKKPAPATTGRGGPALP